LGTPSQFKIVQTNAAGLLTRSIVCQRDADGRIVAISDPNGLDANGVTNGPPALTYEYAGGNLIHVNRLQDKSDPAHPVYLPTRYEYTNAAFPHYITGIQDSRGITAARNLYDESGRLIGIVDASGKTNRFVHDLNGKTETIFDRMGNPTTYGYDTRGNVT